MAYLYMWNNTSGIPAYLKHNSDISVYVKLQDWYTCICETQFWYTCICENTSLAYLYLCNTSRVYLYMSKHKYGIPVYVKTNVCVLYMCILCKTQARHTCICVTQTWHTCEIQVWYTCICENECLRLVYLYTMWNTILVYLELLNNSGISDCEITRLVYLCIC